MFFEIFESNRSHLFVLKYKEIFLRTSFNFKFSQFKNSLNLNLYNKIIRIKTIILGTQDSWKRAIFDLEETYSKLLTILRTQVSFVFTLVKRKFQK